MTKNLQTGWHFSIPKYPSLRPRPYLLYDLYCTDLFIWIDLLPRTIRQSPCIAFNLMRVVHKFAPVISAPREWVMKCERGNNISIRFGDSRFLDFPRFSDSCDLRCSWDQVVSFCVEKFSDFPNLKSLSILESDFTISIFTLFPPCPGL